VITATNVMSAYPAYVISPPAELDRTSEWLKKQDGPHTSREMAGRLRTGYPEPGDSLPLFFFLPPSRLFTAVWRTRAPASIPKQLGLSRKVHQYERYESDRVADRPFALRAEALDRRG
jgi:hypothetical protein